MSAPFITPKVPITHPRLWKNFTCGKVRKAQLTVTGLGLYRAFLNGKRIGRDYLTPGFNDYDAYLREQIYDVTGMLKKENQLEVWLGNGWYKGRLGFDGGKENRWGDRYLLAARLEITLDNGESLEILTDENIIEHNGHFRVTILACSDISPLTDALEQVIKDHGIAFDRIPEQRFTLSKTNWRDGM